MTDNQRVYIKGDLNRGDEIIKLLKDLGGLNSNDFDGHNSGAYYFIGPNGVITNDVPSGTIFSYVKEFYTEIKLPKWKPKHEDYYYFINYKGVVVRNIWVNSVNEDTMYEFGNCFKTFEEAEAARDSIKEMLNNRA